MSAVLRIGADDVSGITPYDVTVSVGRDDIYSQPDGSVLNATVHGWERAGRLADPVTLVDAHGSLFVGWITDLKATLEMDMTWTTDITATGPLALLGQMEGALTDYPQESDSERVLRIIEATPLAHLALIDPDVAGFEILPRLAEPGLFAVDLARSAADDGMGVLWECPADPGKPIRYTQARLRRWGEYRHTWSELPAGQSWAGFPADLAWADLSSDFLPPPVNKPPAFTLDPAACYADLVFEQKIGDLARTITVRYGAEPVEGSRPAHRVGEGAPLIEFDTQLALSDDAAAYANMMVRRYRTPAWRLTSIRVEQHLMDDPAELRAALQVGTRLTVPIPEGSPVGIVWEGYLEGWDHALAGEDGGFSHIIEMHVSDKQLTEPADQWLDIPPHVTWDSIPPEMRWVDATDWDWDILVPTPI